MHKVYIIWVLHKYYLYPTYIYILDMFQALSAHLQEYKLDCVYAYLVTITMLYLGGRDLVYKLKYNSVCFNLPFQILQNIFIFTKPHKHLNKQPIRYKLNNHLNMTTQ